MTTRDEQDARYWPTRAGLVAAICAAAEPYVVPACQVTVWDVGDHRTTQRPCGVHAAAGGLCARHHADKERLS